MDAQTGHHSCPRCDHSLQSPCQSLSPDHFRVEQCRNIWTSGQLRVKTPTQSTNFPGLFVEFCVFINK